MRKRHAKIASDDGDEVKLNWIKNPAQWSSHRPDVCYFIASIRHSGTALECANNRNAFQIERSPAFCSLISIMTFPIFVFFLLASLRRTKLVFTRFLPQFSSILANRGLALFLALLISFCFDLCDHFYYFFCSIAFWLFASCPHQEGFGACVTWSNNRSILETVFVLSRKWSSMKTN